MWRINVFHLSARVTLWGVLTLLFTQCQIVPADEIPEPLTLIRGSLFKDPVVQTIPQRVSTITVDNKYDKLLSAASERLTRPTSVSGYGSRSLRPILDSINLKELMQYKFQWQTTGLNNVMVCIFEEIVKVDKTTNKIENKSDLVWLWTPSTGKIDPGRTTFTDGQVASWNELSETYTLSPAKTLDTGYYIWCVLAWDKQGINIVAASRELPIRIIP